MAAALGLGFALGPTLGGFVGEWWGLDKLFLLVAVPQTAGLFFILLARGHRTEKPVERGSLPLWRVGKGLLAQPGFLGAVLAIFQSFLCLIGVTRIAFPFLAVRRGLTLDIIGTMVSISRLADTAGRLGGGWLCDRVGTRTVILLGVFRDGARLRPPDLRPELHCAAPAPVPHDRRLRPVQRRLHHPGPATR